MIVVFSAMFGWLVGSSAVTAHNSRLPDATKAEILAARQARRSTRRGRLVLLLVGAVVLYWTLRGIAVLLGIV